MHLAKIYAHARNSAFSMSCQTSVFLPLRAPASLSTFFALLSLANVGVKLLLSLITGPPPIDQINGHRNNERQAPQNRTRPLQRVGFAVVGIEGPCAKGRDAGEEVACDSVTACRVRALGELVARMRITYLRGASTVLLLAGRRQSLGGGVGGHGGSRVGMTSML